MCDSWSSEKQREYNSLAEKPETSGSHRCTPTEMMNIIKVLMIIITSLFVYNWYYNSTHLIVRVTDPKFSLLGPYNVTEYELVDNYHQLIDIHNFTFKINPHPCQGYDQGLLLVVIVSSKPDNFGRRNVIRRTWGRSIDSMKVVFLMGDTNNETLTRIIEEESRAHGDVVQGSFTDAYRNMTYKHVMGLKWVSHHCPTARYILKTDDDVVVNSQELRRFLARELSPWGAERLIMCKIFYHSKIQRKKTSKWYVTETEFSGKYYPAYCAGMAIVYSLDAARQVSAEAARLPYFWIDDVQVTGVAARRRGVPLTALHSLVLTPRRAHLLKESGAAHVGQFLFGPQDLATDNVLEIWKSIPK